MPEAVASRYAGVLADLATKPGSTLEPQRVVEELETFENAFAASAGLRRVLLAPAVPPVRKRAVITELARAMELSDLVKRFLFVLIDHRRTELLPEIREAFESEMDERLGVVRVDVASARELTAAQRERLAAGLARLTGKQARTRFNVEPELIGGVVARIGSTVYDGSVRGQLEDLKRQLTGGG
jgi:F-type H+-transporting ATPase subunit delta